MLSLLQTRALAAATPVVQREENCVLHVYDDGEGNATVGWGFTFYLDGTRVKFGDPDLTQAQADQILDDTLRRVVLSICDKLLMPIGPNQLAAMVDLSYNIGLPAFGTSSVLAYFNAGRTDEAHASFALWNKVHKGSGPLTVSPDLVRRRAREMVLFETPWIDPVRAPQPPALLPDFQFIESFHLAILTKLVRLQGLDAAEMSELRRLARSGGGVDDQG